MSKGVTGVGPFITKNIILCSLQGARMMQIFGAEGWKPWSDD
jgi:hypothetical protein